MGARSAAASLVRHVGGVAAEAFLIAALIAAIALAFSPVYAPAKVLAGSQSTLAAKGGNSGYSITLLSQTGAAATAITYGSTVMTLATYGSANPVYARVACTANGSTVTSLAQGALVYDVFIDPRGDVEYR